jgi:hypothetical protein
MRSRMNCQMRQLSKFIDRVDYWPELEHPVPRKPPQTI